VPALRQPAPLEQVCVAAVWPCTLLLKGTGVELGDGVAVAVPLPFLPLDGALVGVGCCAG
jgi:hypothetical protein